MIWYVSLVYIINLIEPCFTSRDKNVQGRQKGMFTDAEKFKAEAGSRNESQLRMD